MLSLSEISDCLKSTQIELQHELGVKELHVFGSVARGDSTEQSDVDILVEFDGPASLDRYVRLKDGLEALLNMPVDLVTRKALRPALRETVEREAVRVA